MKLLHVKANNFKNCKEGYEIDFVAKSKKTAEDKEYELQEVADGLYVYNTIAFIGKNASGKTTAVELLDACYSILGEFRLEGRNYSYDNVELIMDFYYNEYIYRYETILTNSDAIGSKAFFTNQKIYKKKYYKTKLKSIYADKDFEEVNVIGELPEDTSKVFFILKKRKTRAIYFDSYGKGIDTYKLLFAALKDYNISSDILGTVVSIFDENITDVQQIDEHNYYVKLCGKEENISDKELLYRLSSEQLKECYYIFLWWHR